MKEIEFDDLLASRTERLGGAILDGIISLLIMIPILVVLLIFYTETNGEPIELWRLVFLFYYFVFGWVIFFLLNGYLLVARGQTIGKLIMKTKIVTLDKQVPPPGSIIVKRYIILPLIYYILPNVPIIGPFVGLLGIFGILLIFEPEKRCLHDYIAGTYVIKAA